MSEPMGRVSGDLAARTNDVTAGAQVKVLWVVRVPHERGLRLEVERLDGPGIGKVMGLGRTGPSAVPWPAGWERAETYASNVTFDSAGCWRIRDLDGSEHDAIVFEVAPRPPSTASASAGAVGVPRDPQDLPELPEEARVLAALASVGLEVDQIAVSKFQDLLQDRRPARVFGSSPALREPWRVDIVFFDGLRGVRVCPSPADPYAYTLLLNSERAAMASTKHVFFAANDRLFVMASEERARDALRQEFGLSVPTC